MASDHAGFAYKEEVKLWLLGEGAVVVDHGAKIFNPDDDFPDFIALAALAVSKAPASACAIIFGGSGQGEAILANRFPNVRATVFYGGPDEVITLSRQHNDANILSIGARFLSIDDTKRVIWNWLTYDIKQDDKYTRRNQKIESVTRQARL